jgi:hypothetical protein
MIAEREGSECLDVTGGGARDGSLKHSDESESVLAQAVRSRNRGVSQAELLLYVEVGFIPIEQ